MKVLSGVVVVVGGGKYFSLKDAYLSNVSLLLSLKPSDKFVVVVVGPLSGWWLVVEIAHSVKFSSMPSYTIM